MASTEKLGLVLLETTDIVDEMILDSNTQKIDDFAKSIDTRVVSVEDELPTFATSEYVDTELAKKQNTFTDEVLLDIASISNKVDKEEGKGLSSNDYNDDEKDKLAGIEDGADVTPLNVATTDYVDTSIADIMGAAVPETLDTISEIAAALQNEESVTATILNDIGVLKAETIQDIKIKGTTLVEVENVVNLPTFEIQITKLDGTIEIYDFVGIKR